jgi:mono/diheme cytochrome c family protein
VRRLIPLSLLAVVVVFVGTGCGVPGGEITTATPDTVVGKVPSAPKPTVPPEYAKGDPTAGKAIFTEKCGTCHTLGDAGTSGTIGPNLDQVTPDLALILDRLLNGKGVMPSFKGQLTTKQIADVAAYVAQATSGG